MPAAEPVAEAPLDDDEIQDLLSSFHGHPALVLAVSGGPDSLGLMVAAARWRALVGEGPVLHVASVDHGLRPEAAGECAMVVKTAGRLGLPAAVLAWDGDKPATGLQEAARDARHRLLVTHARAKGATGIVLAHHREDQAETVLMRLVRGSGPLGLKGMAATAERDGLALLRPFLFVPKARLAATARAAGLTPVHDPSNDDPRFTRVRIRRLFRDLAGEGLDAERLAILAGRMQMLDAAGAHHAARLAEATMQPAGTQGAQAYDGLAWLEAPFVDVLRLLADTIATLGDPEVDARLEALEALTGEVLMAIAGGEALRRNLQGALVSVSPQGRVIVAREPARRSPRK
ncbi:tRNA lysidine(34) synthetase TilS [Phreatobacter sp.]|uniref:tRNA lysidine(34) synthetase TilS n=1 Tax=Phreatobacter sp. TaxID=1966341 RepID=UPI0022C3EF14|nr:tRNA lysidine(34) synthetase TilS [Phreatobacter sp.]MCZ8315376.1 tRNA lysidine(34) synthetase TilS [Phreatobacter sp.]